MSVRGRRGFTLLELIVVVALVAILAGVAVTAGGWSRPAVSVGSATAVIAAARARAIADGHPVEDSVTLDGRVALVRAAPDGTVQADSALGASVLDGAVRP